MYKGASLKEELTDRGGSVLLFVFSLHRYIFSSLLWRIQREFIYASLAKKQKTHLVGHPKTHTLNGSGLVILLEDRSLCGSNPHESK
ncbi:hypothetical protein N665_0089s0078 [Sinapis alba]|nr:hypothetical protein N665_0089s0078 [Sinapis alba]